MIGYASRTGTRRNLQALKGAGWRLLVSAKGAWRTEGFRYGLDNGAWTAHQQEEPFDEAAFRACLSKLGPEAEWIVIPDIVAGGLESLRYSVAWLPELDPYRRLLLAVQDGMEPSHVRELLGPRVGIFVGGTTDWKLSTMNQWGMLAREANCHLHVARVNSNRRISMCHEAGAHSFDGTSATRYAVTLPLLDNARRQTSIFDRLRKGKP